MGVAKISRILFYRLYSVEPDHHSFKMGMTKRQFLKAVSYFLLLLFLQVLPLWDDNNDSPMVMERLNNIKLCGIAFSIENIYGLLRCLDQRNQWLLKSTVIGDDSGLGCRLTLVDCCINPGDRKIDIELDRGEYQELCDCLSKHGYHLSA
jgi:hypothetical protein